MEWYIGSEWVSEKKGLTKKVLNIKFEALDKPSEIAKVVIAVEAVDNIDGHETLYLAADKAAAMQELQLGTARTPIDYYVELLVRQMIVGEEARCSISTKSGQIDFVMRLEQLMECRQLFQLNVKDMYQLALQYKENGVVMFKEYPKFAHEYFARAAKFLISYKPFEALTSATDGVDGKDMTSLFMNIQTNLAACLLLQKRYQDVLYQTQYVETTMEPTDKSIYRRALAYYHMNEFEAALKTMEKLPNYQEQRDFAKLHANIKASWKTSNSQYKDIVQRMFN